MEVSPTRLSCGLFIVVMVLILIKFVALHSSRKAWPVVPMSLSECAVQAMCRRVYVVAFRRPPHHRSKPKAQTPAPETPAPALLADRCSYLSPRHASAITRRIQPRIIERVSRPAECDNISLACCSGIADCAQQHRGDKSDAITHDQ